MTNRADSPAGTEILIFGGKIQDVRDAGAPRGTDIAVRNLFFNVPARRKFLRSAQTEFTHIRQAFLLEALAHVGIEYALRADDADVYRLPATANLLDRIRDLIGFLDRVRRDRGEGLLHIPRATALRIAQPRHDRQQGVDVTGAAHRGN